MVKVSQHAESMPIHPVSDCFLGFAPSQSSISDTCVSDRFTNGSGGVVKLGKMRWFSTTLLGPCNAYIPSSRLREILIDK